MHNYRVLFVRYSLLLLVTIATLDVGMAADSKTAPNHKPILALLDRADSLIGEIKKCHTLRKLEQLSDETALYSIDMQIQLEIAQGAVTKSRQDQYNEYFATRSYEHETCVETTRVDASELISELKRHAKTENQRNALKEY